MSLQIESPGSLSSTDDGVPSAYRGQQMKLGVRVQGAGRMMLGSRRITGGSMWGL